jgi:hypothetical protein
VSEPPQQPPPRPRFGACGPISLVSAIGGTLLGAFAVYFQRVFDVARPLYFVALAALALGLLGILPVVDRMRHGASPLAAWDGALGALIASLVLFGVPLAQVVRGKNTEAVLRELKVTRLEEIPEAERAQAIALDLKQLAKDWERDRAAMTRDYAGKVVRVEGEWLFDDAPLPEFRTFSPAYPWTSTDSWHVRAFPTAAAGANRSERQFNGALLCRFHGPSPDPFVDQTRDLELRGCTPVAR